MRYLKSFNEGMNEMSMQEYVAYVTDFCTGYLAYLLDDEFSLEVTIIPSFTNGFTNGFTFGLSTLIIELVKSSGIHPLWGDIKDYYIPFFVMVDEKFNLKQELIRGKRGVLLMDYKVYSIEDVLEDNVPNYIPASKIRIIIEGFK
jgi:hypothetical protein